MADNMLLVISTPDAELNGRRIESNIETLLPAVKEACSEYKSTQYTIDQERLCKEHRARVNKFFGAVKDEVSRIGELNNAPFKVFQEEMKPVLTEVESTIAHLDKQLKEMEAVWRGINIKNAEALYHDVIGYLELEEWIPWDKVLITKKTARVTYEADFGNKGSWNYPDGVSETTDLDILRTAGSSVVITLQSFADMVIRKQDSLMNTDYSDEIKAKGMEYMKKTYDPVKKGLDFDGAISLMTDLRRREIEKAEAVKAAEERAKREAEEAKRKAEIEKQKAVAEAKAQAEMEKQKAIEEQRALLLRQAEEMEKQKFEGCMNPPENPDAEDAEQFWVAFRAHLTINQALALKSFFEARNIEFEQIEEE